MDDKTRTDNDYNKEAAAAAVPAMCSSCDGNCLDDVEFLMGLNPQDRLRIMQGAVRRTYEKDRIIFHEGDPVDALFVIHSGKVKLSSWDAEGREKIVGIFTGGDTIWEGFFLKDSHYSFSGTCITPADICRIHRSDLEAVIQDPAVSLRVIGFLSQRLHETNENISLLNIRSPKARLAAFLMHRCMYIDSDTVTLRLDDIASSINLRPETVSRKLKELEKSGLVEKTGQSSIRVIDMEGLREETE